MVVRWRRAACPVCDGGCERAIGIGQGAFSEADEAGAATAGDAGDDGDVVGRRRARRVRGDDGVDLDYGGVVVDVHLIAGNPDSRIDPLDNEVNGEGIPDLRNLCAVVDDADVGVVVAGDVHVDADTWAALSQSVRSRNNASSESKHPRQDKYYSHARSVGETSLAPPVDDVSGGRESQCRPQADEQPGQDGLSTPVDRDTVAGRRGCPGS